MGNSISNATAVGITRSNQYAFGETTWSNPTSTIVNSLTKHPPFSYSVKIENLTHLNNEKYQSRRFMVGGYYWRLVIYPGGNNEDNGGGFISMYVEIDNTKSTSEVFAYVKFFVYNTRQQKYFTIQDTEVKRFNTLRMVSGFSQVLPLYFFKDPKNGYILEGNKCEFGVEVMVVPPLTNWEVVSFNKNLLYPEFSLTFKDFSKLRNKHYVTNNFSVGGREWYLKLYPKGRNKGDGIWLSFFLHLADSETLSEGEKIYVHVDFRVVDTRSRDEYCDDNHVTNTLKAWFKTPGAARGWDHFMATANLREGIHLDKGTLTLEVKFKVVSTTKYSHL